MVRPLLFFLIVLSFVCCSTLSGQVLNDTINSPAGPIGGLERLALRYYDIEFTPSQRALIDTAKIELIFFVSDEGVAQLESVNGVRSLAIIDSLRSRNGVLPRFKPEIRQGIPKQSFYFVQIEFPSYQINSGDPYQRNYPFYRRPSRDDFEDIKISKRRFDMVFGGMANAFSGSASDYLDVGGGMKVELVFTADNQLFYGMNMNFFGNKRSADYNIESTLPQYAYPATLFLGGTVGRWMGLYAVQLELDYALQNITERLENDDSEWVQFSGFSPGLLISRPLQIGRDRLSVDAYYGLPTMIAHYINLSLGFRYLWLDHKEASGLMAELGISYRLGIKMIDSYKLKDTFYE